MSKYFVIGDIHGRLDLLSSLLRDWNKKEEQLVFLGDYIDYGPNSRGVMYEIMHLTKQYNAIPLLGNHDLAFYDYMKGNRNNGNNKDWIKNGRKETYNSFLRDSYCPDSTLKEISKAVNDGHMEVLNFIESMDLFLETDKFILSHSGLDLSQSDWKQSEQRYFIAGNGEFIRSANQTGKIIVFGHYRTGVIRGMNEGKSKSMLYSMPFLKDDIWVSPDGTKLGIDGGAPFGGVLHGVHLDDNSDEITVTTVSQGYKINHKKLSINQTYNRLLTK